MLQQSTLLSCCHEEQRRVFKLGMRTGQLDAGKTWRSIKYSNQFICIFIYITLLTTTVFTDATILQEQTLFDMSVRDLIVHCIKQRLVVQTGKRRDPMPKKRRTRHYPRTFRRFSPSSKNKLIAKLILDRKKSSQKISRLLKRVAYWKAKVRGLREAIA